jgi:hypothetical protein
MGVAGRPAHTKHMSALCQAKISESLLLHAATIDVLIHIRPNWYWSVCDEHKYGWHQPSLSSREKLKVPSLNGLTQKHAVSLLLSYFLPQYLKKNMNSSNRGLGTA